MKMRHALSIVIIALAGCNDLQSLRTHQDPYGKYLMPANDWYVVPGHRIGRIYLGMPLNAALDVLGKPTESRPGKKSSSYLFDIEGMDRFTIVVDESSQTISSAQTMIRGAKTPDGVQVGDSDARIKGTYGRPQHIGYLGQSFLYCYDRGMVATLEFGNIRSLEIVPRNSCG